ncbi:HEPN domain-containing protein [Bernardetia sp. ABR2-2B]|uniref:ApeA N-terminal domain 1-containing protein n=1 Tax=Bernardetia sp. ABR2-2B TaxID=3127472 RepID=UPI0030CD1B6E
MKEIQEYRGEWFSPKKQEVKIPGILTINQKENEIKLILFSERDIAGEIIIEREQEVNNYYKIILGIVSGGKHITLYDHSKGEDGAPILEQQITNNFYESVYRPQIAFIGTHFYSPEDIKFNSYSFRYNYLDSWIDTTQIFFHNKYTPQNNSVVIPSIPHTEFQVGENCSATISRNLYSKGGLLLRNYDLEVKHYVKFSFDTATSLQEYFNLSAKFRAFLAFAVGYPISTIDEFAVTDNTDEWHKGGAIRVFNTFSNQKVDNKRLTAHYMFFCSQHNRQEVLINYLSKWFESYDTYHSSIDIFLHAVLPFWKKGNTRLTNVQFTNGLLNICQAIETFYNRDNEIDYPQNRKRLNELKQKGYDKIRKNKELLKLTDEELEFYNKYFKVPKQVDDIDYKRKVMHYLNKLKVALDGFIDENEFEEFAKEIKNCRNTLTHVNHDGNIETKYNLWYLFNYSQILFYTMIVNLIGIEQIEINKILKKSDKFRRYYKKAL